MLLALLMLVAGLLGGPLGGPPTLWFETDRIMGGGTPSPAGSGGAPVLGGPLGAVAVRGGPLEGGVPGAIPGGGVELADRGGPLGGGGVAFLASGVSAPAFLLTQRLSSGS